MHVLYTKLWLHENIGSVMEWTLMWSSMEKYIKDQIILSKTITDDQNINLLLLIPFEHQLQLFECHMTINSILIRGDDSMEMS